MPARTDASTRSPTRIVESISEYSLWTWRWTNSAGMDAGRGGSRQRKARLPARQGLTGVLRRLRGGEHYCFSEQKEPLRNLTRRGTQRRSRRQPADQQPFRTFGCFADRATPSAESVWDAFHA